jgi:hypothetical protein
MTKKQLKPCLPDNFEEFELCWVSQICATVRYIHYMLVNHFVLKKLQNKNSAYCIDVIYVLLIYSQPSLQRHSIHRQIRLTAKIWL